MLSADAPSSLTIEDLLKIYERLPGTTVYFTDLINILNSIAERDSSEDTTIGTLETDISALSSIIAKNTKEILYLHNLVGLLVFELLKQGIEIEDKRLLNEFKTYIK